MVSYEGLFFEGEAKRIIMQEEKNHLPIKNDEIHCTFIYHPSKEEFWDELVGKEFPINLIAYGCDGKNSGFEISLPEELKKYYRNKEEDGDALKKPHITVSLTEDSKAAFTKDLDFIPLEEPIPVTGKFGYWIKEDENEYLTYTKQK